MDLTTPLTYVKGIGPGRAAMLEAKGLTTVEDLLGYVPFRYEDRSNMKPIGQLAPGEMATVIADVRAVKMSGFKRRSLGMFEARFTDVSSSLAQLPADVLQAQNLLRAACAARTGEGKTSSLVVAGREGMPPEPGGLLSSPNGAIDLDEHSPSGAQQDSDFITASAGLWFGSNCGR